MDQRHTFLLTLKDQPRSLLATSKKKRSLSVTGVATTTAVPSHLLDKQTSKSSGNGLTLNSRKEPLMGKSRSRRSASTSDTICAEQERSSSMRHARSDTNPTQHTSRKAPRVSFALSSGAHENANGLATDHSSQQQIYTSGVVHGGEKGCCCGGVPPYRQPFQTYVACPCMTASPLSASTLPYSSVTNLSSMNGAAEVAGGGGGVVHVEVPPSVPISKEGAKEVSTASHPPCSSLLCQPQGHGRNSTDARSGPPLHVVDIAKITLEQKIAALEAETAAAQHQLNEKEAKRKELSDVFDREKKTLVDLKATVDKTVATIHATRKINVDFLNSINSRGSQAMVDGHQPKGGSSSISPELLAVRLADKYMRSQYASSISSIAVREMRRSGGPAPVAATGRSVVEKLEDTRQVSNLTEKDASKRALGHDEAPAASSLPPAMAMTSHLTLGDLEGLVEALRVRLAGAQEEAESLCVARSRAEKQTNAAREATERLYSINATLEPEVCRLRDVVLKKRTAERSTISKQIRSMQIELENCQCGLEKADAETRDVTRETFVFVTRKERHDAAIKGVLAEHDSLLMASREVKEKAAERQLAIDSLTAENKTLRLGLTVRSLTRPVGVIKIETFPTSSGGTLITCSDSAAGLAREDGRTADGSLCRCISGKALHSNNKHDNASSSATMCAAEESGARLRRVCVLCQQPVCEKQQLIGRGRFAPKSSEDAVLDQIIQTLSRTADAASEAKLRKP